MEKSITGIKAILFDMDGTLVDSSQAVENAWRSWAERHGFDPGHVVETAHGRPARDTIQQLAPHLDQAFEAEWVLNKELTDNGVVPIPGVHEFLAALHGLPWAIVTSANRSLALHRLRLADITPPALLVTVEDITRGKPDPQGYLLAAKKLAVDPATCLVVEDTPAGLSAGRSAGMRLLGICTTFPKQALHAEVLITDYLGASYDPESGILVKEI